MDNSGKAQLLLPRRLNCSGLYSSHLSGLHSSTSSPWGDLPLLITQGFMPMVVCPSQFGSQHILPMVKREDELHPANNNLQAPDPPLELLASVAFKPQEPNVYSPSSKPRGRASVASSLPILADCLTSLLFSHYRSLDELSFECLDVL